METYDIASVYVHVNAVGIFSGWDEKLIFKDKILAGQTDRGFLKPASNTIGCLYNINRLLINIIPTDFSMFSSFILKKLSAQVIDAFDDAEKMFEA